MKPHDDEAPLHTASRQTTMLHTAPAVTTAGAVLPWLPPGRIVELTGRFDSSCTTMAVAAIARAQTDGETTAWLQAEDGPLFPPDLQQGGVDLDALLVVHVPARTGPHGIPRAAELLLQSGAFGLLVLDLRPHTPPRGAWLARLLSAARQHKSRVLLLTENATESLGSLVSLRVQPRRRRRDLAFAIDPHVLTDKLHGQGRAATQDLATTPLHVPEGL
ncbi:MAG: recombinase A [Planctomycetes bacterium]|nr:recombinase A [Planctomycetota bacterium]